VRDRQAVPNAWNRYLLWSQPDHPLADLSANNLQPRQVCPPVLRLMPVNLGLVVIRVRTLLQQPLLAGEGLEPGDVLTAL